MSARAALATAACALLTLAAAGPAAAGPQRAASDSQLTVRLLAIADLHGTLSPPDGDRSAITEPNGAVVPAGGAAYLSAYVDQLRDSAAHSLLYSVGDNWGVSPLESAMFRDEPTVEFLNHLGISASGVGNHELDRGIDEFRRLQSGGCHPSDGCRFGATFDGAQFPLLSSNMLMPNGIPATMPFSVDYVDGIPVGVVSALAADTGDALGPGVRDQVRFADELATIDRTAGLLDFLGVHAIVLLLHQGDDYAAGDAPSCGERAGPGHTIATEASPLVDIVFTADNADRYDCTYADPDGHPRTVMNPAALGRGISVADVTLDRATRDIVRDQTTSFNQTVTHDISPDVEAAALTDRAVSMTADRSGQAVGVAASPITRTPSSTGESALGNLVADAQLAAGHALGAQVALTNPGGLRADLAPSSDGIVDYGAAHRVQPFDNPLDVVTLTGAQLTRVLEQQFQPRDDGQLLERILAPSRSLTYSIDRSAPVGGRISHVEIDGVEIDPNAPYRVAINRFLARGGDGFTEFTYATDHSNTETDLAAFVDYLAKASPIRPPERDRITLID
ncbi:bifunctional metallophosphatase/5'-nucleotidase [Rhodococcus sp. HNM0569]|nr:bifunctional metallophosphatase/5'-nucleotidase [Rhodococcus sp. HNM0569]